MRPCRESPFDSKPRPSAQPTQRRHPPAAGHPEHNQPEPVPRACPQDSPGACPQGRNLRSLSLRDSSRSPRSLRLRVEAIPGACPRSLSTEPVHGACPQGWLHPGRSQTHEPVPASPTHLHPQKPPLSGACPLGVRPRDGSIRAVPKLTNLSLPALPTSIPKSPPFQEPVPWEPVPWDRPLGSVGPEGQVQSAVMPPGWARADRIRISMPLQVAWDPASRLAAMGRAR